MAVTKGKFCNGGHRMFFAGMILAISLLCTNCASGPSATVRMTSPAALNSNYPIDEYRIHPGDLLDIKFLNNTLLSDRVLVRPDGRISLQLVNDVMAAGLTPAELTTALTEKFAQHIQEKNITVIIRSFSSLKVYVQGEVDFPRTVDLKGTMTALQAISDAGGFLDTAFINQVIVIRHQSDKKPIAIELDMEKVLNGSDTTQDIYLIPQDIIYVPKTTIAKVDIWVDQNIRKVLPFSTGFSVDYHLNRDY